MAISTGDARIHAKRRLPRMCFDFIEGCAGREYCYKANQEAFDNIRLQPRVLENVVDRTFQTTLMGCEFNYPFGIAPMGMCNLTWPGADRIMANEAVQRGIPLCISSSASTSLEDMRKLAGENAWFQLYVGQNTEFSLQLVERACAAGYETLLLTVDVPTLSRRTRDIRNGFQVPFRLGPRQLVDFMLHPHWSIKTLYAGIPRVRNFDSAKAGQGYDRFENRAGADWKFLDNLRKIWKGNLVVKGVLSKDDAIRIKEAGADAIYVSNHGGRQLDAAPPTIEVLPRIREVVGSDFTLMFDSGIRNGEDIIRALVLGANFVFLGRPILYAIGADGARGLTTWIDGLVEEASSALAQLGLTDVAQINASALYS